MIELIVDDDRTRGARRDIPPEPIELCDDEAIRKARRVDSLDESAVTAVARAHDGQMGGWCQARQVLRWNHRIVLCEQHGRRTGQGREPRAADRVTVEVGIE